MAKRHNPYLTQSIAQPGLRIRRCAGNREAWALVMVRGDGSEAADGIPLASSYSLDWLVGCAAPLIRPGDRVELIVNPAAG